MGLFPFPTPTSLAAAAVNARDVLVQGGLADMRRMPRTVVHDEPLRTVYRYTPPPGVTPTGDPVLLVPPLGAPAFCFDLRRGCSLVEHLVAQGRRVYLVEYGPLDFTHRRLGVEFWVDDVVPTAVAQVSNDCDGAPVRLVGWCLGGLFSLLSTAAYPDLPVASVTAIASPFDISAVPLLAPFRPLAAVAGGPWLSSLVSGVGGIPAPVVKRAFQLSSLDKYLTKPLTVLSKFDDRDFLEQIEAVDHLMANMYAYPGRTFGQLYHLMFRANDLAEGRLSVDDRVLHLADVRVPVLAVAGLNDVLAPLKAVRKSVDLLTGSPEVRFESEAGGHLGILTGRGARETTWRHLDEFLEAH